LQGAAAEASVSQGGCRANIPGRKGALRAAAPTCRAEKGPCGLPRLRPQGCTRGSSGGRTRGWRALRRGAIGGLSADYPGLGELLTPAFKCG